MRRAATGHGSGGPCALAHGKERAKRVLGGVWIVAPVEWG